MSDKCFVIETNDHPGDRIICAVADTLELATAWVRSHITVTGEPEKHVFGENNQYAYWEFGGHEIAEHEFVATASSPHLSSLLVTK